MSKVKRYAVKEIFGPTIQGEATLAGTPCRFLRFAGCNMWDGRAETRLDSACPYCDTDFFGGQLMTANEIIEALEALVGSETRWVWISGGEPLLQLDVELACALVQANYMLAIETNGTVSISTALRVVLSHVTVSPKVPFDKLQLRRADTLKLLYPHPNSEITPEKMEDFYAPNKYLQPIDPCSDTPLGQELAIHNRLITIAKLHELGNWRLSLQTHKILGLP